MPRSSEPPVPVVAARSSRRRSFHCPRTPRHEGLLAPVTVDVLLTVGPWCPAANPPIVELAATRTHEWITPPSQRELRFRRVFVPEGMKNWPKGNVKYLPLDADEFERLLDAIQRTAPAAPVKNSAGLVDAQYDGRLKGAAVLQGSATLNFSQSIASATLMTLDPATWRSARRNGLLPTAIPPSWELPATESSKYWPNAQGN